jgi:hypothetical protein
MQVPEALGAVGTMRATTRLRPRAFAVYRARSAVSISASGVCAASGRSALAPTLTVT